ncbi:PREDICTED: uncharacterized protein LOC109150792 [Ipomoea nil]|uniref:uncharacterized protein LOC109150792 n=1 Tax=Ipomoea nil TaxID=35883 RepID=UPI00090193A0|nr:PREDICTED: uncharacterized protein LOC109150792 [Ipomoea nil]
MCMAFYSTLTGRAAEWFRALQPGSIADFETLARKFNRKFVTSKVIRKPYMYLEKAKQLEGESLSEFLVKWKAAVGEVEPMDNLTAIHMLQISLRASYLYQDFILHPPSTCEEALRRVTDYANAGEANAIKRSQEVRTSSRKPVGRAEHRSGDDHPRPRTRPGEFTMVNRSAAKAMQYAQSCNLIRLFHPGQDGPDKSKHCAYHRCAGHDTEECTHLRQLLEGLLNLGKLDKCVGKREESKKDADRRDHRRSHHCSDRSDRSDRSGQDRRDPDPPSSSRPAAKPTIHVIFGGLDDVSQPRESCPVAIVDSRETGKKLKMEPITFSLEDQPNSGDHGMEALVVTIDVMGTDVHRVMVDTGSSVNVLYLDVFEKLKLDKRELIPVGVIYWGPHSPRRKDYAPGRDRHLAQICEDGDGIRCGQSALRPQHHLGSTGHHEGRRDHLHAPSMHEVPHPERDRSCTWRCPIREEMLYTGGQ